MFKNVCRNICRIFRFLADSELAGVCPLEPFLTKTIYASCRECVITVQHQTLTNHREVTNKCNKRNRNTTLYVW